MDLSFPFVFGFVSEVARDHELGGWLSIGLCGGPGGRLAWLAGSPVCAELFIALPLFGGLVWEAIEVPHVPLGMHRWVVRAPKIRHGWNETAVVLRRMA